MSCSKITLIVKSYCKRGSYNIQIKIKKLKITLVETHENLFTVAKIEIIEIEKLPTFPYPYVTLELGA
jgi:hypothetical protein